MLPILSEMFPNSPYILKASTSPLNLNNYCKKPIFSREGANIELFKDKVCIEKSPDEGYIYQELVEIPEMDGKYPIIGSWIIGGESAGIGIRETNSKITDNLSEFVPHIIE